MGRVNNTWAVPIHRTFDTRYLMTVCRADVGNISFCILLTELEVHTRKYLYGLNEVVGMYVKADWTDCPNSEIFLWKLRFPDQLNPRLFELIFRSCESPDNRGSTAVSFYSFHIRTNKGCLYGGELALLEGLALWRNPTALVIPLIKTFLRLYG